MKLKWLGHACFMIEHGGYRVVIDPYDSRYGTGYPELKTEADKLLVSHEHLGHNCRSAVKLSGRPESDCPFKISTLEVCHDTVHGAMRGMSLIHILEADGIKVIHMGDAGAPFTEEELEKLRGADALIATAGSNTGLPAQAVWRLCQQTQPRVLIPMHYRFENHGNRRLEHVDALINLVDKPEQIKYYDTDTIEIDSNTEPQLVVLKYLG